MAMAVQPMQENVFGNGATAGELVSLKPMLPTGKEMVVEPLEEKISDKDVLQESVVRVKNFFTSGGKQVLVQVWYPVEAEGHKLLTTRADDKYLETTHAGTHAFKTFRDISDDILFPVDSSSLGFDFKSVKQVANTQGLPGRVWLSKTPELTPSVQLYSQQDYARLPFAIQHGVQSSFGMPLILNDRPLAVLEVATLEKNYEVEATFNSICDLLSSLNLKSTPLGHKLLMEPISAHPPAAVPGNASEAALNIMTNLCLTHNLPLLQCWDAKPHNSTSHGVPMGSRPTWRLSCRDAPFVIEEQRLWHLRSVCAQKSFAAGEGAFGKLLCLRSDHLTNQLIPNVSELSVQEYPLRNIAADAKIQAVMWCVCSTIVGGGPNSENSVSGVKPSQRVIEIFLPRSSYATTESMHAMAWLLLKELRENLRPHGIVLSNAPLTCNGAVVPDIPNNGSMSKMGQAAAKERGIGDGAPKRSTYPKSLNRELLQKHFHLPLKDAAKALGVCTTTLKRACRAAGIKRWPSRKLKKLHGLNRSVKALNGEITWFPKNAVDCAAQLLAADVDGLPASIRCEPSVKDIGTPESVDMSQARMATGMQMAQAEGMGHVPNVPLEGQGDGYDNMQMGSPGALSGAFDGSSSDLRKAHLQAAENFKEKEADHTLANIFNSPAGTGALEGHLENPEWETLDPFNWPDDDMAMLDERVHGGSAVAEILGLSVPESGPQISHVSHSAATRPNDRMNNTWGGNQKPNALKEEAVDLPENVLEEIGAARPVSNAVNAGTAIKLVNASSGDVVKFRVDSYDAVEKMRQKAAGAFGMEAQRIRFRYKDEEGDVCLIEDEDDMQELMWHLSRGLPNRVQVTDT